MNVSLRPEVERFVDEQVKAGHFATHAEVLEAGVARLMLDENADGMDAETLAAIDEAQEQLDLGEGIPLDEAFRRLRAKHFGG
jgi:Arc/MetJ-type ribon-helix-helix transcriptional regulator